VTRHGLGERRVGVAGPDGDDGDTVTVPPDVIGDRMVLTERRRQEKGDPALAQQHRAAPE